MTTTKKRQKINDVFKNVLHYATNILTPNGRLHCYRNLRVFLCVSSPRISACTSLVTISTNGSSVQWVR